MGRRSSHAHLKVVGRTGLDRKMAGDLLYVQDEAAVYKIREHDMKINIIVDYPPPPPRKLF